MSDRGPDERERDGSRSEPRPAVAPAPALALRTRPEATLALREAPPHPGPVAGLPAVLNALRYTGRTAGIVRGARALLGVNQQEGFDCPGCAWPDPESPRHLRVLRERRRAVAARGRRSRRSTPRFFARTHRVAAGADRPLARAAGPPDRADREAAGATTTSGSVGTTPSPSSAALTLLAPRRAAFYTSGRTSNEAAFLYQLFARSYGTNNLPDCSNMCHESSGKGLGNDDRRRQGHGVARRLRARRLHPRHRPEPGHEPPAHAVPCSPPRRSAAPRS
jgi:hypothetical protein